MALVERCRQGDLAAFEAIYRTHSGRLYSVACRMLGNPADAEDLLQDVFLTAHRKLDSFRGESALGTWLYRLTTNLCLDYLRSRAAKAGQVTGALAAGRRSSCTTWRVWSTARLPTCSASRKGRRSPRSTRPGCGSGQCSGGGRTRVMACERYLNAIDELIDGTLGPIRRAELELHLETCEDCRALVEDLRELSRATRSLDRLEPPERVWTGIASRLAQEGRVARHFAATPRHRSYTVLALAAALILTVAASLFLLRPRGTGPAALPAQTASAPHAGESNVDAADPVQGVASELALTEEHLQRAIEQAARSDQGVDPQTVAVLQKNLQVVNQAIAESRAALQTNPQSTPARQTLYDALRQKIQFLQDTIALMNEMRKGDAAGAAEIVESGKSS
jgi:RNA polymerase sigma factor (sigma-70 family)